MSPDPSLPILCPSCRGPLAPGEPGMLCPSCGRRYPLQHGALILSESGGGATSLTEATVQQFGASWQIHAHLEPYHERQFLDWIAPLEPRHFRGAAVLEAGCGKGRHSRLLAGWGPAALACVDLSEAVFLASANTRGMDNARCLRADLQDLPFPDGCFDAAICVGVLHHLEDPRKGLQELWRCLKPGGTLCLWVYAKEGNGWVLSLVDPVRRHVTSKIPTKVLRPLLWPLSGFLYGALKLLYAPITRRGTRPASWLPYSAYLGYISKFPFREVEHIVLDHLCPPIAAYLSRATLESWFAPLRTEALAFRWHNRNSWNVIARKAADGEGGRAMVGPGPMGL